MSNIVLAALKAVLALVFVSSSTHALITHAQKYSFNPVVDPYFLIPPGPYHG